MAIYIPIRPENRDIASEYRQRATSDDKRSISGRDRHDITELMARAVIQRLGPLEYKSVLDIGCGDGALLRMLPQTATGTGTALTAEECKVLACMNPSHLTFIPAGFDDLEQFKGQTFDAIILNGCLHFAFTRAKALRILSAVSELLTPNGVVWIGEIIPENPWRRVFPSRLAAIRHARGLYGNAFALRLCWHILRNRHRWGVIIQPPSRLFTLRVNRIADFAEACGLEVGGIWWCSEMTECNHFGDRYSALLRKPMPT